MSTFRLSRRKFLQSSSFSGAAMVLGGLVPASVLGANDRIHFGVIGTGAMGTGHLSELVKRSEQDNVQCLAVCDVFQRRLSKAISLCQGQGYRDYRRLLERNDIDAVLIATPDHWHAKMAIDAMEAGKHVYVEKPMTLTVEQAIQTRNAVRRYSKVLQVGPQATGDDAVWQAHEAIKEGRIGKVTWAQGGYNRNFRNCLFNSSAPIDPAAGPSATGEDYIDWDMWLGHEFGLAPKIPYNSDHFFRFRKYWPYNGGVATDLLYHKLAPLLLAIAGPNGEYPLRVNSSGGLYVEKDGRDIPDTLILTIDYPSEYSIFLISTLTNDTQIPDRIYGKHGTLEFGAGDPELRVNGEFAPEFKQMNQGYTEVRLARQERKDMKGNFVDVIRGNGKLHCNAELGAATMVAIRLGVEAYRQRKTMVWDSEQEKGAS
jgi:predicted dehydrogenase